MPANNADRASASPVHPQSLWSESSGCIRTGCTRALPRPLSLVGRWRWGGVGVGLRRCGALLVLGDVRGRDLPGRIASAVTTGAPTTLLDVPRAARALRYLFTVFPPKPSGGGDDDDDATTSTWQQVRAKREVRCPSPQSVWSSR